MRTLRFLLPVGVLLLAQALWSEDTWQAGRIVDVQKKVDSKTLYWVANTPVTREETTYTISVHLKDKILTGLYTPDKLHAAPPEDWVRDYPVKIQVDGDDMYLRPLEGNDLRLRIAKRKSAPMLEPVPAQELEKAYAPASPGHVEALTGFIAPAPAPRPGESQPAPAQEAAPAPESETPVPVENPEGTLSVTTFPYLAEVFVDGKSVGYSPAKVILPAGKHTVRFEKQGYKSWSKDVTVQENSETVVDATLDKQKK